MVIMVPVLITLTYFFNAELSKMTIFKVPPSVIRSCLALFWAFLYISMVPRHLQFYMQQGFKDSVKDLKNHSVNANKVRMHFQKRVTLVIYSACQYCSFPIFIILYLLFTGHKSGLGKLGHARPFNFGTWDSGSEFSPVVSRSTLYDAFQAANKNSDPKKCEILPLGSYRDEEEGFTVVDSKVMWELNKDVIQFSLKDMWDDSENFSEMIKELPFASRILFSKEEFDDSMLVSKLDQKKAKELKEYKDKVNKMVFPLLNHTIISPPFFVVWFECLGFVACVLWSVVYIFGVIRHVRNKEMIEYDFTAEITETGERERESDPATKKRQ